MKIKLFLFMLMVSLIPSLACNPLGSNESGQLMTHEYTAEEMQPFDSIDLEANAIIYYKQGEPQSVKIEYIDSLRSYFRADFRNGKVRFVQKRVFSKNEPETIKIYITNPSLKSVETNGRGEFHAENLIVAGKISFEADDKSRIVINNIDAKKMKLRTDALGTIDAKNIKCPKLGIESEELSSVTVQNLKADIKLLASDEAKVTIDNLDADAVSVLLLDKASVSLSGKTHTAEIHQEDDSSLNRDKLMVSNSNMMQ